MNELVRRLIDEGGVVLVVIVAASVIAWALLLIKYLELRAERKRAQAEVLPISTEQPEHYRVVADLWLNAERGRLEQGLSAIQALAALLPLLGLLGTVLGMLKTFEVIKVEGTGDPRLMADGIRQALITTQAGILAALPVLLFARVVTSRADRQAIRLEQEMRAHQRVAEQHAALPAEAL